MSSTMNAALLCRQPLCNSFLDVRHRKHVRYLTLYILGIVALTISAKISVPLAPVPVTLETLVVLMIGMTYGWRLGSATIASFLMMGAMGAPLFAPPMMGGLAAFAGPTGGFLLGFLPAAFISGLLVEHGWGHTRVTAALAAIAGMAIIYLCGLCWLTRFVGVHAAIAVGFTPFLMVAFLKIVILTIAVPMFWKSKK